MEYSMSQEEIRTTIQTLPLAALSYDEKYPTEYQALKDYGLSPFYALRVLVDFQRGDSTAIMLVSLAKGATKP